MAAAAFTVRMALTACGIDNVALFQGETNAERIADQLFSNEFGTCIDKTDAELTDEMSNFANLLANNGRIRLAPGVTIRVKAFIHWASHCLRQGIDPSTLPFPVANTATLIRQSKTHKKFCDDSEVNAKAMKPKTLSSTVRFED